MNGRDVYEKPNMLQLHGSNFLLPDPFTPFNVKNKNKKSKRIKETIESPVKCIRRVPCFK